MTRKWRETGIWAAPLGWCAVAGVAVRAGRVDGWPVAAAAVAILLGVGLARQLAGSRGGGAGRAAELVLVGGAVGLVLAEPASHRVVIGLATALAAVGLALTGVARAASVGAQRQLVPVVAAAVGTVLACGLVGAPWWGAKALLAVAALAVTGWALAEVVPPGLATAATVAVAVAVGPGHVRALALPPLGALALVGLASRRSWLVAACAVAAAAVAPPAGLAVAAGLLVAAARMERSPLPLVAAAPALLLARWLLPAGLALAHAPRWSELAAALPVTTTALPLLLPAVALGLAARRAPAGDARDGLVFGLLVLPMVGGGGWSAAAAVSLWLLALPAAAASELERPVKASLAWTFGAGLALLLLAPWGGAALVPWRQPWLTVGWAVAVAFAGLPHRASRLAWVLPAAGLLWTVPVEGRDRHLAAGEVLSLPATPSGEWVLLVALDGPPTGLVAGQPVLAAEGGAVAPLRAGTDCPLPLARARRPLVEVGGLGREAHAEERAVSRRKAEGPIGLRAAVPVVVRVEDAVDWRLRRHRVGALLAGGLALLLLAFLVPGTAQRPLEVGCATLLGAGVAAGSSVEPLALCAARAAPDLAAAVLLAAWLALLPALGRRRLVAGALLLMPLALAQPLLRVPAGDEVYHLRLLESLVQDHDLDVANNLDRERPEEAAYLPYGSRLVHSPALALAVLPGYLVLGHSGALALLALAVAAGAALVARRAEQLGAPARAVGWAWALSLATYPALTFATQLWPDGAAVFLVALVLWAAARPSAVGATLVAAAAMVVKVRLGLVAVPVAVTAAFGRRRGLLLLGAVVVVALGVVAALVGGPLERHGLGELLPASAGKPFLALWGLVWDAAGGLAFAAPLWLVAALWLPAVWRRGGAGERALVVGAGLTGLLLVLRRQGEWFGGGSPPARYLVPLLPLAMLATVEAVRTARGRWLLRLALPWAAVVGWVAATRPLWLFNPADGGWWLADRLAAGFHGAARTVFPSLIRPSAAALVVPLLLLAVAAWWTARPRAGAAGLTALGLALAVAVIVGGREARVHAEDPQVRHLGGAADPPSGTVNRAAQTIAWRLPTGTAVELPWRPWQGRSLEARVRLEPPGGGGALRASWDGGPVTAQTVRGAGWQVVPVPPSPGLGRGWLRLEWQAGEAGGDLLVDWVGVGHGQH